MAWNLHFLMDMQDAVAVGDLLTLGDLVLVDQLKPSSVEDTRGNGSSDWI